LQIHSNRVYQVRKCYHLWASKWCRFCWPPYLHFIWLPMYSWSVSSI